MNYNESINYLNSFIDYEKLSSYNYNDAFKLDRVEALLTKLGSPHKRLNFIHIAGTKGKGSTSAFIHSILKNSGLCTGLYTSPHLLSFHERIRINSSFISKKDLISTVNRVRTAVEDISKGKGDFSFFEIYTACALLYFFKKNVDFAILETGLGGRLDATNVVNPKVAVITRISYEHMDKLGKTIGSIATEKAGIIKENSIAISSLQMPKAREVIREHSRRKNAILFEVGSDIRFRELGVSDKKTVFDYFGLYNTLKDIEISLLGPHQILNAVMAIGVCEILPNFGVPFSENTVRRGLNLTNWPGRFQIVKKDRTIILDGAQNRDSSFWLRKSYERIFTPLKIPRSGTPFLTGLKKKPIALILGVLRDKDVKGIARELSQISKTAILTKANTPRALEPNILKEMAEKFFNNIILADNLKTALEYARGITLKEGIILITGSLYLVADALKVLKVKVKF
ncbi:MAG: bifunctional folylpolyglutamate synthase/dihydrofolate synthase [Candidatus Omnitrophica bacterium]|nr:bifunctional folylpolyglutamate synthase/dihydrofolate synthase [Candidatus Omnitrophota bacterium]